MFERSEVSRGQCVTNSSLGKIVTPFEIDLYLTTHSVRHTFSTNFTLAKSVNIESVKQVLRRGLDSVTDINIDLDLERIDRSNQKVIMVLEK